MSGSHCTNWSLLHVSVGSCTLVHWCIFNFGSGESLHWRSAQIILGAKISGMFIILVMGIGGDHYHKRLLGIFGCNKAPLLLIKAPCLTR